VKIACDRLTTLKKHPLLDGVDINKIGGEALRSDVFHGGEALAYVTDGSASYPGVIAANDTASVYFAFDPLAQERFIVNTLRWFIENDRHDVPAGMSQVPAGKFNMKVPREEMTAGRLPDEMISREVFVSGFYMDKYEITNKEYEKFDPAHKRSDLSKDDDMPVTNVTMFDAKKYCNWRSAREKLDPVYAGDKNMTADLSKNGYRLPTVAEWQKAAAGPEGYKYSWGNFWWRANGRVGMDFASGAVKAGSYFPNYYGLYDMTGNVWEWCEDYECYPYRQGRLCGGDWTSDETESRVEFYNFLKDDLWRCSIGFRCARNSLALKHGVSGVQKQ
jgi:formylglycine-generating enzyme required for sulfatase activity